MPNIDQFQARSGRLIKEDGTVVNEANGVNADGSRNVQLSGSNMIQPVDIQARLSQTIQTHNAVSVGATTGTSDSSWIDTDGFSEIGITLLNDASTANSVDLHWSADGITWQGGETPLTSSPSRYRAIAIQTKARYVRVRLNNTDAAAHTMSAWAYLKA